MGRPRKYEREIRILEMLAAGVAVGKIAADCGVHRNTVGLIRKRSLKCPDSIDSPTGAIAELVRKRDEILRGQEILKEAERKLKNRATYIGYLRAVEAIFQWIINAKDVTCKSVFAVSSMDQELADGFTRHDVVGSTQDEPVRLLQRREIEKAVTEALDKLDVAHRLVIEELFWGQKSLQECCDSLDLEEREVIELRDEAMEVLSKTSGLKALAG